VRGVHGGRWHCRLRRGRLERAVQRKAHVVDVAYALFPILLKTSTQEHQ
jgi:hypothetical protein